MTALPSLAGARSWHDVYDTMLEVNVNAEVLPLTSRTLLGLALPDTTSCHALSTRFHANRPLFAYRAFLVDNFCSSRSTRGAVWRDVQTTDDLRDDQSVRGAAGE